MRPRRTSLQPSRTATLYRVAYRRENRDPSKGYTYKVFKGEQQARAFIDRLTRPVDETTPDRFRNMGVLAEVHLHVGMVHWENLDAPRESTNLLAEPFDPHAEADGDE